MNRISLRRLAIPAIWAVALVSSLVLNGCRSRSVEEPVARMGELVVVGPLRYTVFDTEWKTQIGDGPDARFPKNRYLIVHLSVTNSGGAPMEIPTMKVETADGITVNEVSDPLALPEWLGILRQLRPADTIQGKVVFDVPLGACRLRVGSSVDAMDEKTALVDIPIQYAPAELPAPASPQDAPAH